MHRQLRQCSNLVRNRALLTLTGVREMTKLVRLTGQVGPNRAYRRCRRRATCSICTAVRASHTLCVTISQEPGAKSQD